MNPATQTVEIGVSIESRDERIKAGMFAQLELITDRSQNAVIIPSEALVESSEGFQVYVVRRNSTAEKRRVLPGIMKDDVSEIISGLEADEDVIVQGQGLAGEGVYVKVVERISTGLLGQHGVPEDGNGGFQ